MAATIDDIQDQMMRMSRETNAAKVIIGWETISGGYLEVTFFSKKPRRK